MTHRAALRLLAAVVPLADQVVANAGEAAVRGRYCQGEAGLALALAAGRPADRDTILLP